MDPAFPFVRVIVSGIIAAVNCWPASNVSMHRPVGLRQPMGGTGAPNFSTSVTNPRVFLSNRAEVG